MTTEIPDELKRACLEKILDSASFARAEQLRNLLRWLGEKALEGGGQPTEYEVGRLALHRGDNFDPQTDSLVRKEMSRLRAKLKTYYAVEGGTDVLRVQSADAYRLTFQWLAPGRGIYPDSKGLQCLLILPLRPAPGCQEQADAMFEELFIQLGEIEGFNLVSQTTARSYGQRDGDARSFASETGASYLVEGSLRTKGDMIQVTLWLVDGRTGLAQQISRLVGTDSETLAGQAAESIVQRLELLTP